MRILLKKFFFKFYKIYVVKKIKKEGRTTLLGKSFLTDPFVFHPTLFISTKPFIQYLIKHDLKDKKLLDMGTGSGAIAIFGALYQASVTAADINPKAVELTKKNAAVNNINLTIYLSDLFTNIPVTKFDYIFFNIPFYPKKASTLLEKAFNAGENYEVVDEFSKQAINYLKEDGQLTIIFNEDSDIKKIVSIFLENGYKTVDTQKIIRYLERLYIYTFRKK